MALQERYSVKNKRLDFIKKILPDTSLCFLDLQSSSGEQSPLLSNSHHNEEVYDEKDIRKYIRKDNFNFGKMITKMNCKLEYKKSGASGHTFKAIKYLEDGSELQFAIKVVAYKRNRPDRGRDYGTIYNKNRPENCEILMLKALSDFVLRNNTQHIVLPILTFNSSIRKFLKFGKPDKNGNIRIKDSNGRYDKFIKAYEEGELHDTVSVLLTEWANGSDLLVYLREHFEEMTEEDWRIILFQLIYTLAIIQEKYPSFRHNDLKANNILVFKSEKKPKRYFIYQLDNMKFYTPNTGLSIALWDFDFACIPDIVDNKKVLDDWTTRININPVKNRYYDLHYFFNTLSSRAFFPQFFESEHVPSSVKKFALRVVPEELRKNKKYVHKRGRILTNIEHTTPYNILKNDHFFDKLRPKEQSVRERRKRNRK